MLHILLLVLKICGILLLVILGLVLLVLCLLLFVPIRYKGEGQYDSIAKEGGGGAAVTWLLSLLRVKAGWDTSDKKLHYSVKVLWLTLLSDQKKDKKPGKRRKPKKASEPDNPPQSQGQALEPEEKPEPPKEPIPQAEPEPEKLPTPEKETVPEQVPRVKKKFGLNKQQKRVSGRKNRKRPPKKTGTKPSGKTDGLMAKKDEILKLITDEHNQNAVRKILHRVFMMIRYVLPVRLKAEINFGMDNPADTGTVLAALSVLYGLYGPDLRLQPDFENKLIRVRGSFKGRIRLGFFVRMALLLVLDKEVRRLIRAVLRLIKGSKKK